MDLLAWPMHWLTGPILAKELRVASRRKRMYVLRLIYLAVMALILVPIWSNTMRYSYATDVSAMYRMADLGRTLVPAIVWIQFIAVQLVAMLTMSTSVSDEISRRTLGTLLTTPMNAWQLVMGKLASRLVQCVSLLMMSLPILALLTVFGGVKWSYVLVGLALTLSTMLIVSSVTMFFSIFNRRPYVVFLESLLALGVLFGGSLLMLTVFARTGITPDEVTAAVLTATHPVVSLVLESIFQGSGGPGGIFGGPWLAPWWVCVISNVVFSSLMLCLCVRIVRRASLASAMGMSMAELRRMDNTVLESPPPIPPPVVAPPVTGPVAASASATEEPMPFAIALLTGTPQLPPLPPRTAVPSALPPPLPAIPPPLPAIPPPLPVATASGEPPASSIKSLAGNPVYWKDTVHTRPGPRTIAAAAIVLGLLACSYLAVFADNSGFPRRLHVVYFVLLGALGSLVAMVVSASAVPAEREARTWDMVLASPLSSGRIVWGKFLTALRRFWPAYLPLGIHVVLFTLGGSLRPVVLLHVAAIVAGSVALITAVGILIGTHIRRTTAALVATLLLFLMLWIGLPLLTMMAEKNTGSIDYPLTEAIADANPFVQLVVTGHGSTHDDYRYSYRYSGEHSYGWSSGYMSTLQTTRHICLVAGGHILLATLALLLARNRLRRAKE